MTKDRRRRGMFSLALAVLACLGVPAAAAAGAYLHYGPPAAGANLLIGRAVAGGAGTLPNDFPAPTPWNLAAGEYCAAHKLAQPSAPTTSAPLPLVSDTNLVSKTGFDPSTPREIFQLRHLPQADSSSCQAKNETWGFWVNAGTPNNYCASWCGVRHDYSSGQALGTRPWANGYGFRAQLVMTAFRHVETFSGIMGWEFICVMLQDTTTSQRLEYCMRPWRSWADTVYDPPLVFFNPKIGTFGTGFAAIVSDITAEGTPYLTKVGGASTIYETLPHADTFAAAITRTNLVNAMTATNATIKAKNLGTCLGILTRVRCYSTDPDKYAFLGVEDGLELRGTGTSHMGGFSSGLTVFTDY